MGEAKRRKLAGTYPTQTPPAARPDRRHQIADIVRSLTIVNPHGGTCLLRALAGKLVLQVLGIDSQLVLGGMVYRAGTDPERDQLCFAGPDGGGIFLSNGQILGHTWLEADGDLIDFSPGDWMTAADTIPAVGRALPPVQWTHPPPEFFWGPRADFNPPPPVPSGAWTPSPPGQAWYLGWAGTADETARFRQNCHELLPDLRPALEILASRALRWKRRGHWRQ